MEIQTLYFDTGFTRDQICLQLDVTYRQVCDAIRYRLTPQKRKCGAKPFLNSPQRKRLIE
ncbi:hypothetical protein CJF32_00010336 [Rutstroemia sp. NJR-2017a WRK4]|nr:hypothetical protein CJF32_00010336 [Rutstroemia sp. NJR-2017a WRK4]